MNIASSDVQDNTQKLHLLGISHKTANIEIREKFFLNEKQIKKILSLIHQEVFVKEVFILSTCNRTEYYIVANESDNTFKALQKMLLHPYPDIHKDDFSLFYYKTHQDAISHLFQLACGLDSIILGETQIFGQLKSAYKMAQEQGVTHIYLNKLIHAVIEAGKHIRHHTNISAGSTSIASAIIELTSKIFKDFKDKTVLFIGAGKMGQLTMQYFFKQGIKKLLLWNRTVSTAQKLAEKFSAEVISLEALPALITDIDIIVCSTSYQGYLIDYSMIAKHMQNCIRPLLLIDMAVPRNIDPKIRDLQEVFLYDIDSLQNIILDSTQKRQQAIPYAIKVIQQKTHEFIQWSSYLRIRPTILQLKQRVYEYVEETIERTYIDNEMYSQEDLRNSLNHMAKKILKMPIVHLQEYISNDIDGEIRIDVLKEIFDLQSLKNFDENK